MLVLVVLDNLVVCKWFGFETLWGKTSVVYTEIDILAVIRKVNG